MLRHGGFLIAPSGTCFARLREDEVYRRAVIEADLAIADSGLMVLMWRLLRGETITRISGFKYLKHLLRKLKWEGTGEIFWVLPSERARQKLFEWSRREAFPVASRNCAKICPIGQRSIAPERRSVSSPATRSPFPIGQTGFILAGFSDYSHNRAFSFRVCPTLSNFRG